MTNRKLGVNTWKKELMERVLQETWTKPFRGYIKRRQATVAEWVALRPIFEVFVKETGFEGRGRARNQWWRQTAAERQMETTLKEILAPAWEQRRQESGRRGEGERGTEESDYGGDS